MSTRFKSNSRVNYGQSPLPTGYEKFKETPDLFIPSCGLEDVDVSLFKLFDKEISPEAGGIDSAPLVKVPIVFAAGEKWALLKRGRPIRDRNNTLLLPLITIMRTEVVQDPTMDVAGRGINQQLGEIVIRRKLDKSDRSYQSLINRLFLTNQQNLAAAIGESTVPGQLTTEGKTGRLRDTAVARAGAYLANDRTDNVYETIVVPTPQFYTAKYQVTVWTQYTQHSNQILEKIISSFLPQGQCWRLDTTKGYWFVASVEAGTYATETNFDDMSQQERFIKHTFEITVPAYFFVSSAPGSPVPIKRYVSSPVISFETTTEVDASQGTSSEYTLGSDDPTLPLDLQKNVRTDQRTPGWRQQKVYPVVPDTNDNMSLDPNDPALLNLPRGYSIRVVNKTPAGETVYSGASLGGLEIVVTK